MADSKRVVRNLAISAYKSQVFHRWMLIAFLGLIWASILFLRLYRTTLAEMRIYQVDLTALAIQQVAVEAALSAPDADTAAVLSKDLLSLRQPAQTESKTAKEITVDPQVLADLLQKLAKAVIPKEKGE